MKRNVERALIPLCRCYTGGFTNPLTGLSARLEFDIAER